MANNNNATSQCLRTPRLVILGREAAFLGTCLSRQEVYRTTQELMLVCLHGEMVIQPGAGNSIVTRSCLVPPGVLLDQTRIDTRKAVMGLCFLQPFSQDYPALASLMVPLEEGICYRHPDEDDLIRAMTRARNQPGISAGTAVKRIRQALIPERLRGLTFREFDPRVLAVARRIRTSLHNAPPLARLAREVDLSESRLEKLFKEQAGLPITQYRVRYRVFISTIIMALGYSVTEAALLAGFSNSAHLSRCYRQVNGLTPSSTFLSPPYLDSVIDESAIELVNPLLEGQPVA
ncbi:AraC family transcriptional regulator [Marinobacter bryozoorum]|uniref:helix-turn-helix domain-containing protein n=1 Tax=Marinobacter bryozoorum TaxID=256324 RepID=UPI0020065FD0|nr:AraC family transcriptional regulator [Marinobacter bryozoorum]MCK7543919.1 AraC family transcriptional regulator [Marinobacter bryozoorum]